MLSLQRYFDAMGRLFSPPADTELFDGLPRVEPSDYETSPVKRDRMLKHLLRANHHNYAIMTGPEHTPNQLPHILGSAYLLGARADDLQELYDIKSERLDAWEDSPLEISRDDWRDYLGDRCYQRAYMDFFEDEVVRMGYNWKEIVIKYMLSGDQPLLHGAIGAVGHPLIHLGYAFELNNREIAMEALALVATNYSFLHRYIDFYPTRPAKPQAATSGASTSPLELLAQIHSDPRFQGLTSGQFAGSVESNVSLLFSCLEPVVLGYYDKLSFNDITTSHRELARTATVLLCAAHEKGKPSYDFAFGNLLSTAYAVRILLPELPRRVAPALMKAQWLLFIIVYCIQLRPKIQPALIDELDVSASSWDDLIKAAMGRQARDKGLGDSLKVVRLLNEFATLWDGDDIFYRRAATKFSHEFDGWSGIRDGMVLK